MRLLKILFSLFLVLAMAAFLAKNSDQPVTIWLYPGTELMNIDLAWTMLGTLAIGILMGFIIGLVQIMAQHREIAQQSRQLKKLRTELNNLRHSGLEEDLFEEDAGSTSEMEDSPSTAGQQLIHLEK